MTSNIRGFNSQVFSDLPILVFISYCRLNGSRCGKVAKAHALFLAATESDEALNVPAVRSLLRDSATSGQPASASSVTSPSRLPAGFASIRRSGIQVNVRTCNTLMKGYRSSSAQSHQRCEQVLDTMKSLSILPDSVTMNTLVDAYALAGEMAQAESVRLSLYMQIIDLRES